LVHYHQNQKKTTNLKEITDISPEVLDAKEQELNSREQFVGVQEQYIKEGLDSNGNRIRNKPNWPICCPFLYHSVWRGTKKGWPRAVAIQGYIGWFLFIAIIFVSFGISIATVCLSVTPGVPGPTPNTTLVNFGYKVEEQISNLFDKRQTSGSGSWTLPKIGGGVEDFNDKARFVVTAFLQFVLFIPIHFYLCYWPLYKCMSTLSTARFIIFFIGYDLAIIFDILSMSGIYELGFTGVYVGVLYIPTPKGNIAGVVMNGVMVLLWLCLLIYHIIIYIQVLFLFRRENYYLRKLGTHIKNAIINCFKGALKKSVEPPK
jgi:hypothetical protein